MAAKTILPGASSPSPSSSSDTHDEQQRQELMSELLENRSFVNWIKCCLALKETREGLVKFVHETWRGFVAALPEDETTGLEVFLKCRQGKHLFDNTTEPSLCGHVVCSKIKLRLQSLHYQPGYDHQTKEENVRNVDVGTQGARISHRRTRINRDTIFDLVRIFLPDRLGSPFKNISDVTLRELFHMFKSCSLFMGKTFSDYLLKVENVNESVCYSTDNNITDEECSQMLQSLLEVFNSIEAEEKCDFIDVKASIREIMETDFIKEYAEREFVLLAKGVLELNMLALENCNREMKASCATTLEQTKQKIQRIENFLKQDETKSGEEESEETQNLETESFLKQEDEATSENIEMEETQHLETQHCLKAIQCAFCKKESDTIDEYQHHLKSQHFDFLCVFCETKFDTKEDLKRHIGMKHFVSPYEILAKKVETKVMLKHHAEVSPYEILAKKVETKEMLKHHAEDFDCPECAKYCYSKWDLINHLADFDCKWWHKEERFPDFGQKSQPEVSPYEIRAKKGETKEMLKHHAEVSPYEILAKKGETKEMLKHHAEGPVLKMATSGRTSSDISKQDKLQSRESRVPEVEVRKEKATVSETVTIETRRDVRSVVYKNDINVRTKSDNEVCYISGCAVISAHKLLLTDFYNKKLKVVNIDTQSVVEEMMTVDGPPRDVAVLPQNQAAVTLPWEGEILIVDTAGKLKTIRSIQVSRQCCGITCHQDHLYVVCYPDSLLVLDMRGNVQRDIPLQTAEGQTFSWPEYIAVSKNGERLYISDWTANFVASLTVEGEITAVYKHQGLVTPRGLLVLEDDSLLVCCKDPGTIHHVQADMKQGRTLTGDVPAAGSMCYHPGNQEIYVGGWSDQIKVFSLQ